MWLFLALLCFLFNGLSAFFFKINTMKGGTSEKLLFGFYLAGSLGSGLYLFFTHTWEWNTSILTAGCVVGLAFINSMILCYYENKSSFIKHKRGDL